MRPNPHETADLFTFTEEILNGKLHFLCSDMSFDRFQKQPFVDVVQNSRSLKFRNIHRKTTVLQSLFNKVADFRACNLI